MQISVNDRWARFIADEMASGGFDSPDGVVAEALNLLLAQREQLQSLRAMVQASLAEGGDLSDGELDLLLKAEMDRMVQTAQ
ncbi:ribbon-helix-helix domain-containing protein [Niveispirillum sp. KHB5.9]|uniref:ribbon-helix-helix domain-containing protein n=1 Tax=Niveispirillum sp. KHB5.9 TaxID=3400269 RepID=UPI003A86F066